MHGSQEVAVNEKQDQEVWRRWIDFCHKIGLHADPFLTSLLWHHEQEPPLLQQSLLQFLLISC
jgi:hypothetical protein